MKTCSKCGTHKNLSEFYEEKRRNIGFTAECKQCIRDRRIEWNNANPEKKRESNRNWREKCDPGKLAFYSAERRSCELQRTPKWLNDDHKKEIKELYEISGSISWLSENGLHVDHIIPLKGQNVCGLHVPWNLQIIPSSENFKKRNKVL